MKLICPSCTNKVDIGSESRYEIFQCDCGREFRGIYASVAILDYLLHKLNPYYVVIDTYTYGPPGMTACIHCDIGIIVGTDGEGGPSRCFYCGGDLPVGHVDVNIYDKPTSNDNPAQQINQNLVDYNNWVQSGQQIEAQRQAQIEAQRQAQIDELLKEKETAEFEEAKPENVFNRFSPEERISIFNSLERIKTHKEMKELVVDYSKDVKYTEEELAEYRKKNWMQKQHEI